MRTNENLDMKKVIYLSILICLGIFASHNAHSKNKSLKQFEDLEGKTEAEVIKLNGKPDIISDCSVQEDLKLKALYWKIQDPTLKNPWSAFHQVIILKSDGKVCLSSQSLGANCRELVDGFCGLPLAHLS